MQELDMVLKIATAVQTLLWLGALFGMLSGGVIAWSLGLAAVVLNLYITYQLTGGVEELEQARSVDMRSAVLKRCWTVLCVCQVLAWLFGEGSMFHWFSVIVGLVGLVAYLVYFNDARKAFLMSTDAPGGIVGEEEERHDP